MRLLALVAGTLLALTTGTRLAGAAPTPVTPTTRAVAWRLGDRVARAGLVNGNGENARKTAAAAIDRLAHALQVPMKPVPVPTGNVDNDLLAVLAYVDASRESGTVALARKYDTSHAGLFRLGIDAQMLLFFAMGGAPPPAELLADARRGFAEAKLPPAVTVGLELALQHPDALDAIAPAIAMFQVLVRTALALEPGTRVDALMAAKSPPLRGEVFDAGVLAAIDATWAAAGKPNPAAKHLTETLDRIGVPAPSFPPPSAEGWADNLGRAYGYLLRTWGPQAEAALIEAHGETYGLLLQVALRVKIAGTLYVPKTKFAAELAAFLRQGAQETGLPRETWSTLVTKIEKGESAEAVKDASQDALLTLVVHFGEEEKEVVALILALAPKRAEGPR